MAIVPPEPNLAAISEQISLQGMSAAQIFAILLAYWKQIAIIAIAITCVGAVGIKLLPKTYTAMATLIVNSDLRDPLLAGRDFPAEMIASYVSTQIELMTSPIVLLPVVDRLKLTEDKSFTAGFSGSADALREFVEKSLRLFRFKSTGRVLAASCFMCRLRPRARPERRKSQTRLRMSISDQDRHRLNDPAGEARPAIHRGIGGTAREGDHIAWQDKVTAFRKENGIGDMNSASTGTEVQSL